MPRGSLECCHKNPAAGASLLPQAEAEFVRTQPVTTSSAFAASSQTPSLSAAIFLPHRLPFPQPDLFLALWASPITFPIMLFLPPLIQPPQILPQRLAHHRRAAHSLAPRKPINGSQQLRIHDN